MVDEKTIRITEKDYYSSESYKINNKEFIVKIVYKSEDRFESYIEIENKSDSILYYSDLLDLMMMLKEGYGSLEIMSLDSYKLYRFFCNILVQYSYLYTNQPRMIIKLDLTNSPFENKNSYDPIILTYSKYDKSYISLLTESNNIKISLVGLSMFMDLMYSFIDKEGGIKID